MISRRDKLLNFQCQQKIYEQHREKVKSAKTGIDSRTPKAYPHVTVKLKKQQYEQERVKRIENENIRLLQKLGHIMSTKRIENFWSAPRPKFLHREKLFETRSNIAQSDTLRNSAPAIYLAEGRVAQKLVISRSAARCPTCSAKRKEHIKTL